MKLIKKLYSEETQSLVAEAIEGLEAAPVGSTATDEEITVTKTGDKDYQITDNSEVALLSVCEGDELSITEAEAQYCSKGEDGKMMYSAPKAPAKKLVFSEGSAAPLPPEVVVGDEVEVAIFTQTVSGTVVKISGDNAVISLAENTSTPIIEVTLPLSFVNVKKVKIFSTAKKFALQN